MTQGKKKSTFITQDSVPDDHFIDTFGNGVNRKIPKTKFFEQIRKNQQTFIYENEADLQAANLEADPDDPVYVRVAETGFWLYQITSLAATELDISLDNGTTATRIYEETAVIPLSDITSIADLNTAALVDGQGANLSSYRPDRDYGGGPLKWDSTIAGSSHDGVNIFSPNATPPSDFNDYAQVIAYLTASPTEAGCFVRVGRLLTTAEAGLGFDVADSNLAFLEDGAIAEFFDAMDYIPRSEHKAIRGFDRGAQDETVITPAIRKMHDDVMEYLTNGPNNGLHRGAIVKFPRGEVCINGPVFSDDFRQKLWDGTNLSRNQIAFVGGSGTSTSIIAKNWLNVSETKPFGYAAGSPVQTSMFPLWMQQTNRPFIRMDDFSFRSFGVDLVNDPIGVWASDLVNSQIENCEGRLLYNEWLHVDGAFDTQLVNCETHVTGSQPLCGGSINGFRAGFPNGDVTFDWVDAGSGSGSVTASEPYFTTEHTNAYSGTGEYFELAGAAVNSSGLVCRITGVTGTPVSVGGTNYYPGATLTYDAATTVLASATTYGSFYGLTGATTADGDQLVLDYPIDYDDEEVGRHIYVVGAGSKVHSEHSVLTTRIVAISGDKKTITMAHNAEFSVLHALVVMAPQCYFGRSDDHAGFGIINDFRIVNYRAGHTRNEDVASAVPGIFQDVNGSSGYGMKFHGLGLDSRGNYRQSCVSAIFDQCEHFEAVASTFEFAAHPSLGFAEVYSGGERVNLDLGAADYAANKHCDQASILHVAPKNADTATFSVGFGGTIADINFKNVSARAPVSYGTNGTEENLFSSSPLRGRGIDYNTSPALVRDAKYPVIHGWAKLLTSSDDLDDLTETFWYRWAGSVPANAPMGGFDLMFHFRDPDDPSRMIQTVYSGGASQEIKVRLFTGGAFGPWLNHTLSNRINKERNTYGIPTSSVTPDMNDVAVHKIDMNQDVTINAPTNSQPEDEVVFIFKQDATGGWTPNFGAEYIGATFGSGAADQYLTARFVRVDADWVVSYNSGWVG